MVVVVGESVVQHENRKGYRERCSHLKVACGEEGSFHPDSSCCLHACKEQSPF